MKTVGNKLIVCLRTVALLKMSTLLSLGLLISPPGQSAQVMQEYKCALVLSDEQPFIAHFSYESEYESTSRMEQDILTRSNETVFDVDGVTALKIKHWVECVAIQHEFQKREAKQIEAKFAQ